MFELDSKTELYGDLTDAEYCAEVQENDEEDDFIEENDPQISNFVIHCNCFKICDYSASMNNFQTSSSTPLMY